MERGRHIPYVLPFPPGETPLTIVQQMANLRANPNVPGVIKFQFWNSGKSLNGRLAITQKLKKSPFGSWITTTYADELFYYDGGYNIGTYVSGSVFSCRIIDAKVVEVNLRLNGLHNIQYIRVLLTRKQWNNEWKETIKIGKLIEVYGDIFTTRNSICIKARDGYPPREEDVIQID